LTLKNRPLEGSLCRSKNSRFFGFSMDFSNFLNFRIFKIFWDFLSKNKFFTIFEGFPEVSLG
jgi:hypothetical protein